MELFDHPANRFVAQFVGSVNLFEGEIRAGPTFVSPTLGHCALPSALPHAGTSRVHLAFRPHAVRFDQAPGAGNLELEGSIVGGEFLGEFMRYEVRVNQAIVTADQPHLRGTERLPEGTRVRLSIASRELRLIDA